MTELDLYLHYSHYFIIVFNLTLVIFTSITFVVLGQTIKDYTNLFYFMIPLVSITIIFYFFPTIMLIFSLLASGLILNLVYSNIFSQWISSKLSSLNLINYLNEIGFLSFFFKLFSFVFNISSANQFTLILVFSHLLSFFYTIFARYYIFFTFVVPVLFPSIIKIFLLFSIFICLLAILIRFLINTSMVIVFSVKDVTPSLWDDFLLTEPLFDPTKNPTVNSNSNNGWFSRYTYNNHQGTGGVPPRFSAWKTAGFGIGICTLGVSCFVAYYTYGSYMVALEANNKIEEANRLKRFELAKAHPKDIDYIYANHPEEKPSKN